MSYSQGSPRQIPGRVFLQSALFAVLVTISAIPLFGQELRTESYLGQDVVAGEIIVRFRDAETPGAEIRAVRALAPARSMVMRSDTRTVSELLREYAGRADVVYAEPNYIWRKEELTNDVFFDSQWALRNTGQTISLVAGTAGADIKATQAWDIAQGREHVLR